MNAYQDLKNQAAELLRQAEELRSEERAGIVQQVREAVAEWGISASELGLKSGKVIRAKLPAKYRDPITGKEWCGRGAMPKWMSLKVHSGASKDEFRI
jgi:DNA-binding protein H-NS